MHQPYAQPQHVRVHDRTRIAAVLLALFFGGLGVHKFYLGEVGLGVLYLLFFWTMIPAIVAFIEAITYAVQSDEVFDRKYNWVYR
jgi:TM2 domain-containing membrane protein YozV